MKRFLELLFGKAAIVGVKTMFGKADDSPGPTIEIDPYTGRETLLSKIRRRQHALKAR